MHIGFIGLSIMGKPMAMNLLKAGFRLTVYNRTAAKCAPLVEAGTAAVSSLLEIARCSDVMISIVSDTEMSGTYPGTNLAYSLFTKAVEKGLGELGTQGLIKLFAEDDKW